MAITRLNNNSITSVTALPSGVGGKVLQVQQTTKLDVFSTSSSSFTDITGLSVSITPSSTSSKILVTVSCNLANDGSDANSVMKLVRGSTDIYLADQSGSNRIRTSGGIHTTHGTTQYQEAYSANIVFLDSPNTTSATTYKVQGANTSPSGSRAFVLGRTGGSSDDSNRASFPASITVMEIAS